MNLTKPKLKTPFDPLSLLKVRLRVIREVIRINNIDLSALAVNIKITFQHLNIILFPFYGDEYMIRRKSEKYYTKLFNKIDYHLNHLI